MIPAHLEPNFVTDMDGFVYYWPGNNGGHYSASDLREIAAELDRRNAEWLDHLLPMAGGIEHH
jgi:hypothetical protein